MIVGSSISRRRSGKWLFGFSRDRGAILLEVMLACAVAGISLAGFAVAVSQSIAASAVAGLESDVRLALESRLAELSAEKVEVGQLEFAYFKGVVVEQRTEEAVFHNEQEVALDHLYRIRLKATPKGSGSLPMETEVLVFQP